MAPTGTPLVPRPPTGPQQPSAPSRHQIASAVTARLPAACLSRCNAQCVHAGAAACPGLELPVVPSSHPTTGRHARRLSCLVEPRRGSARHLACTWHVRLGLFLACPWPVLGRPLRRWPGWNCARWSSIGAPLGAHITWNVLGEAVCGSSWSPRAASKQATAATPPALHLNRAGPGWQLQTFPLSTTIPLPAGHASTSRQLEV